MSGFIICGSESQVLGLGSQVLGVIRVSVLECEVRIRRDQLGLTPNTQDLVPAVPKRETCVQPLKFEKVMEVAYMEPDARQHPGTPHEESGRERRGDYDESRSDR